MNEQIFAIGGDRAYPEVRGGKDMAGRDSAAETARPSEASVREAPAKNKETAKPPEKPEAKKPPEQPQAKRVHPREETKIAFSDAHAIAEVVNRFQQAGEKPQEKVPISQKELSIMKKVLVVNGHLRQKVVDEMTDAQIVVAAQQVLKEEKIAEPTATDLRAFRSERAGKDFEFEALGREEIEAARSADEEILTVKKVGEYLVVVEEPERETYRSETSELEPRIVTTSRRLEDLSRDELTKTFQDQNVEVATPEKWDEFKLAQKEDFLVENKIVNEVEPEFSEKTINGKKYLVWKRGEEYQIYGLEKNLEAEEVKSVLNEFGIKQRFPWNWKKHDYLDRKNWLLSRGVRSLGEFTKIEDGGSAFDPEFEVLTRNQVEKIYGLKPSENWAAMSYRQRFDWFKGKRILPAVAGAGNQRPEWDGRANPAFNPTLPEAPNNRRWVVVPNDEVDLGTVLERRLELLRDGLVGTNPDDDWVQLEARLNQVVTDIENSDNYRFVRLQINAMEELSRAFEATRSMTDFNTVIDPNLVNRLRVHLQVLHTTYGALYDTDPRMDKEARVELFEDLDQLVSDRLSSIKAGWVKESDAEIELLAKAESGRFKEPLWAQGIRDWYVFERKLPEARAILREHRDLSTITDPAEFEKAIRRGIRKAESTNLSSADLNNYYQRILGLITDFPARTSAEIEQRNYLSAEIQAALLINQLFTEVESKEGHPERLVPIFEQIKNLHASRGINTLQMFFNRFRMRYTDGSALEDDRRMPIYRNPANKEGYDFNLMSDVLNILHNHLGEEKQLLNRIEEMQKRALDFNANPNTSEGAAEIWIINRIKQIIEETLRMPEHSRPMDSSGRQILTSTVGNVSREDVQRAWQRSDLVFFIKARAIEDWYKRNTFIGASTDSYDPVTPLVPYIDQATGRRAYPDPVTGEMHYDWTWADIQNDRMLTRIRNHLVNVRGMTPDQLENMEVILRATNLNAQRFILAFGWTEYDGIDVYDSGIKKERTAIYSTRTPHQTKAVDNLFKFFRVENRGRVNQTNDILEEEMPLGYMLPTTRVLVRFTDTMLFGPDAVLPKNVIDRLNQNAAQNPDNRWGGLDLRDNATVKEAVFSLRNKIMGKDQLDLNFSNAQGVAIAYLIDKGYIRFGREANTPAGANNLINWEEEVRDLSRFNLLDLYGDRAAAFKMYDRGALQEYLRLPTFENLMKVYGELFYSGRNIRLFDNMKKAIRAHHKIEQQAKTWFKERSKGTAAETLEYSDLAVQAGRMSLEEGEMAKRELLGIWTLPEIPQSWKIPEKWRENYDKLREKLHIPGIGPVRYTRIYLDYLGYLFIDAKDNLAPSMFAAFLEFLSQIFKQSAQQFGTSR